MLLAILQWLLDGHFELGPIDYELLVLFAFLGTSVTIFATNPKVRLPKIKNGELEPGALGMYVIGLGSAVAVGHKIPVPFLVGMLTPVIIPFLLKSTIPALLRVVNPLAVTLLKSASGLSSEGTEDKESSKGESGNKTQPDDSTA